MKRANLSRCVPECATACDETSCARCSAISVVPQVASRLVVGQDHAQCRFEKHRRTVRVFDGQTNFSSTLALLGKLGRTQ